MERKCEVGILFVYLVLWRFQWPARTADWGDVRKHTEHPLALGTAVWFMVLQGTGRSCREEILPSPGLISAPPHAMVFLPLYILICLLIHLVW